MFPLPAIDLLTNGIAQVHTFAVTTISTPVAPGASNSVPLLIFGNPVKLYADGGTSVFEDNVHTGCLYSLSGQLVSP
jgi:hypothetical protein